jgi:hypothetical protein
MLAASAGTGIARLRTLVSHDPSGSTAPSADNQPKRTLAAWVCLEVPTLDIGAAAGFLADRTNDSDQQAAPELARALDSLPLATAGYLSNDALRMATSAGSESTVAAHTCRK